MSKPKEKINYLEGLRGYAALSVTVGHFIYGFYPGHYLFGLSSPKLSFLFNGVLDISIFFVLSGYVLSYKFFKYQSINILISTAIRRYFRLFMPVFFSFLIGYILLRFHLFYNFQVAIISKSQWFSQYWGFHPHILDLIHQAVYGVFFHYEYSYNQITWTMTYEFLGSFLVFGLAALFGALKRRYLIYAIVMLLLIKTYFFLFVAGLFLSDFYSVNSNIMKRVQGQWFTIFVIAVGLFFGSFPPGMAVVHFLKNDLYGDPINFYNGIGAILILIALLNSKILQKFFSSRIPVFFGKISFAMYLLHFIIISSFSSFLFLKLIHLFSYRTALLGTFFISMPVIIGASYLFWKYIDQGAIRFSQFVYDRFFREENKLSEGVGRQ